MPSCGNDHPQSPPVRETCDADLYPTLEATMNEGGGRVTTWKATVSKPVTTIVADVPSCNVILNR